MQEKSLVGNFTPGNTPTSRENKQIKVWERRYKVLAILKKIFGILGLKLPASIYIYISKPGSCPEYSCSLNSIVFVSYGRSYKVNLNQTSEKGKNCNDNKQHRTSRKCTDSFVAQARLTAIKQNCG